MRGIVRGVGFFLVLASAALAQEQREEFLNYVQARDAGARFSLHCDGPLRRPPAEPTDGSAVLAQGGRLADALTGKVPPAGDRRLPGTDAACELAGCVGDLEEFLGPDSPGVMFQASCAAGLFEVDLEAFGDFRLRNGWHVVGYEFIDVSIRNGSLSQGFTPLVGSDNPYLRLHLAGYAPGASVKAGMRVRIAGPADKDPYVDLADPAVVVPVETVVVETQMLDYALAQSAGALYDIQPPFTSTVSVHDLKIWLPAEGQGLRLALDPAIGPLGTKVDLDLYKGFQLMNGWHVKMIELKTFYTFGPPSGSGFRTDQQPGDGSIDPRTKVHMWAEPNNSLVLTLKIQIEGPPGTNPYQ